MLFVLLWDLCNVDFELSPIAIGTCQDFVDSSCVLVNCKFTERSVRNADGNNNAQLNKQLSTS